MFNTPPSSTNSSFSVLMGYKLGMPTQHFLIFYLSYSTRSTCFGRNLNRSRQNIKYISAITQAGATFWWSLCYARLLAVESASLSSIAKKDCSGFASSLPPEDASWNSRSASAANSSNAGVASSRNLIAATASSSFVLAEEGLHAEARG